MSVRFWQGVLIAAPISLLMWAGIIAAVIHIAPKCSGYSTIDHRPLCVTRH